MGYNYLKDPDTGPVRRFEIDRTRPCSARIWNYWLGGKDYYPVDAETGEAVKAIYPGIVQVARESRYFLSRAVRFLAGEHGVAQFLDIGTGMPNLDNTHLIAQRVIPEARVVYVDNDPLVMVHAQALLTPNPPAVTAYVYADVREPGLILAAAAETLDFSRPIGLMMLGILGNVAGYHECRQIVARFVTAVPPGSYLVINDGTDTNPDRNAATDQHNKGGAAQYYNRSPEQIEGYFEGLELVEPGVVSTPRWRPDVIALDAPGDLDVYCGVARKP